MRIRLFSISFFILLSVIYCYVDTFLEVGATKRSTEDYSASIIQLKNKITAELHLDFFQGPEYKRIKIKGTDGIILWNSQENAIKVYSNKKNTWKTILKIKKFDRNQLYVDEIKHFLRCVKNRKNTINNLDDGIKTMKIALAIKESGKKKKNIVMQ